MYIQWYRKKNVNQKWQRAIVGNQEHDIIFYLIIKGELWLTRPDVF